MHNSVNSTQQYLLSSLSTFDQTTKLIESLSTLISGINKRSLMNLMVSFTYFRTIYVPTVYETNDRVLPANYYQDYQFDVQFVKECVPPQNGAVIDIIDKLFSNNESLNEDFVQLEKMLFNNYISILILLKNDLQWLGTAKSTKSFSQILKSIKWIITSVDEIVYF